ncbi:MAG: tRNA (guanosine(37)-N1)-methyltransferase TrmD [Candidatus Harrisonbacteria bacterium]|nr:tRNA (guanosine(37)-N1)-methyltransferase TrmD [Candidatus Harrisonbacteria bacterium]
MKKKKIRFDILTIFPKIFDSYFSESIIRRATDKRIIDIKVHNIRSFSGDRHRKVDDRPFGGGAGMVMSFEPIARAVKKVLGRSKKKSRIILFSTRGKKFSNREAKRLAQYDQLVFICGRYEGVDERVAKYIADEEISIGDYVLTGGELPAMILVDSISRQIPGVLGKNESLEEVQGSYPSYTRPEGIVWEGKKRKVPNVLLSGDHKKIEAWRKKQST